MLELHQLKIAGNEIKSVEIGLTDTCADGTSRAVISDRAVDRIAFLKVELGLQAEHCGERRLGIQIDRKHSKSGKRQILRQIQACGRFSGSALKIDASDGLQLLADAALMRGIHIGVEQAHDDGFHPLFPDMAGHLPHGLLIERAQETTTVEDAEELQSRMMKGQFNLEDFLEQLQKVKQMGPLSQLLDMIPGLGAQMRQAKAEISDDDYKRVEAIIYSMTADERRNPEIIGKRRAARIARGSGTTPQEVRALIKQFDEMKKMMSQFGRMAKKGKLPAGLPFR